MKTYVLTRLRSEGSGFVACAYSRDGQFCAVAATSAAEALDALRGEVRAALAAGVKAWIQQWSGGPNRPNCPEATIRLPIDLWVCKLFDEVCPTQGQVLLDTPDEFVAHCLADSGRKEQILNVVTNGDYAGFHHIPGRYLCVRCEQEGRKASFQHHYPWELTDIERCSSFEVERDWPRVISRLRKKEMHLSNVTTPLCAAHCIELLKEVEPEIAGQFQILALDVTRTGALASIDYAT